MGGLHYRGCCGCASLAVNSESCKGREGGGWQRVIRVKSNDRSVVRRVGRVLQLLRSREGLRRLGRQALRAVFGIQPVNNAAGVVGSRVVYPLSPFHVGAPPRMRRGRPRKFGALADFSARIRGSRRILGANSGLSPISRREFGILAEVSARIRDSRKFGTLTKFWAIIRDPRRILGAKRSSRPASARLVVEHAGGGGGGGGMGDGGGAWVAVDLGPRPCVVHAVRPGP